MNKPEVLIIGAGPTGLMMACQLALRNISFRIIDKTEDHTTQSRAIVIHARTLEIFQQMGIAETAIQQGKIAKAVNVIINGKRSIRFEFHDMGENLTEFPFLLIIEQSKTETILNNFLSRFNIKVERNTELVELHQDKSSVTAIIQKNNSEKETIETNWLIGADGAHSAVRKRLEIPFLGKTYEQYLYVLDCEVNLDMPPDEMYLSFSSETFAGFFPMTNGRCRVIGFVPKECEKKKELTFEDIYGNFAKQTQLNITLHNCEWISKYRSHRREVSAFRKGRCFLAGDSAHIHSPVGAQGMNTGLQDAYNLAWKLALIIDTKADETLLDSYHEERYGIVKQLITTTDKVFNLVASENRSSKFFLTKIIPLVLKIILPIANKIKFIGDLAFSVISEIGLHYRNNRLSRQDSFSFNNPSPKAGDRVPYNSLRKEFTDGLTFHLLVFSKDILPADINEEISKISFLYPGLIKINNIPFNIHTKCIYKQFGIKDKGFYLIRPDNYIACRTKYLEMLNKYLREDLKLNVNSQTLPD